MSINERAFFIVGVACAWFTACGDGGDAPSTKGGSGRGGNSAGSGGKGGSGGSGGEAASSGESGEGGSLRNTGGSAGRAGSSGRGGIAGEGGSAGRTNVAGESGDSGQGGDLGNSGGEGGDEDGPGCTALRFSAAADTVEIPDDASLTFGPRGTIEAWIFRTEANNGGSIFMKWVDSQEDKVVVLSNGGIHAYTVPVLPPIVTSTPIALATWTHVAFVYGESSRTLFIDGVASATSNVGGNPSNSNGPIHIGGIFRDNLQNGPIRGFIADVRVSESERYSGTFTPEKQLGQDADTMGLWKLDEGTGTTAADSSGNGNTGTISGATWAEVDCR